MDKGKKFYITTAIPYVNDRPHLGHALEFVQADVLARYRRAAGDETLLLSGADENALKNVQAAEKAGVPVRDFIEANARLFADLAKELNVHFDAFQRGSDTERHYPSSQELWRRCAESRDENGQSDMYLKSYEGLYCLGCEAFYTKDELTPDGECYEHPGRKLETVSEKNYFFRLSRYRDQLTELVSSDALRVVPPTRKNEVLGFLRGQVEDISISRSNERARNWGVPVPGDDSQRMYVWFDALNIYQSGVGFGWNEAMYQKWWPADAHLIGKGILRFHAVYWPAFLLSAGLPLPKSVVVHGYITADGQKMSKTVGNVVDPFALIEKYGTDAVRYYLLREIPSGEDGDFSYEKFKARYNGDLANGIGNLAARTLRMSSQYLDDPVDTSEVREMLEIRGFMESFQLHRALQSIWSYIADLNEMIAEEKPFEVVKTNKKQAQLRVTHYIKELERIAQHLYPFMPETSEKIRAAIKENKMPESLFVRIT